jgi:hypothetical protein
VKINGVWRNVFEMLSDHHGRPSYDEWDTSTPAARSQKSRQINQAKQKVRAFFQQRESLEVEVRAGEWKGTPRKVVYSTRTNKKVGTIAKADQDRFDIGERIVITGSLVDNDSDVTGVAVAASPEPSSD